MNLSNGRISEESPPRCRAGRAREMFGIRGRTMSTDVPDGVLEMPLPPNYFNDGVEGKFRFVYS